MTQTRFTLENIDNILNNIGMPQKDLPVVSIAGSNGKGSVSEFLYNIFRASNKITGIYTSPHVNRFTERIRINGKEIQKSEIKPILRRIRKAQAELGSELSKFEIITAIAILYFSAKKCDICIMETGLGGRLDATNVCTNKLASVISSISLEHTEYLGDTLEKIAMEKAGIIKDGGILIDSSGIGAIKDIGESRGCKVYLRNREYTVNNSKIIEDGKYAYDYQLGELKIDNIVSGLRGAHQIDNSSSAITAAIALGIKEIDIIKKAIYETSLAGRISVYDIGLEKKLVVDAAHNTGGFEVLRNFIIENKPRVADVYLVTGGLKDKDFSGISDIMSPIIKKTWCVTVNYRDRALPAENIAPLFGSKGVVADSFLNGIRNALEHMKSGDWLIAAGSFKIVESAFEYMDISPRDI